MGECLWPFGVPNRGPTGVRYDTSEGVTDRGFATGLPSGESTEPWVVQCLGGIPKFVSDSTWVWEFVDMSSRRHGESLRTSGRGVLGTWFEVLTPLW